jgi:RNA recognition motif-containing protein
MNIYAGNLNYKVSEDDLAELFEEYGQVDSVNIIMDKFSGRSKGFGFVIMENEAEANAAIEKLNGMNFEGRDMVVNQARERKNNY